MVSVAELMLRSDGSDVDVSDSGENKRALAKRLRTKDESTIRTQMKHPRRGEGGPRRSMNDGRG